MRQQRQPESSIRTPSPSRPLVLGLCLTLLTILGFGAYIVQEVRALRQVQVNIVERNRKDSLQLLRIQNDLFTLALAMRDMVSGTEPYPMTAWRNTFDRIRDDLAQAVMLERSLAPASRLPAQQEQLLTALDRFWASADQVFSLARSRDEEAANRMIQATLTTQHMEIVGLVSRFLVLNNQVEEEAAGEINNIYTRVQREIYFLVAMLLLVVGLTGLYVIAANWKSFNDVRAWTEQLHALSWRIMQLQEQVLHTISRELHDEFGQIVTAMGTLLGRAKKALPADSILVADLEQVQSIAQEALEKIRTRSRLLYPAILDDFGLEKALQWYVEQFRKQTGIETHYEKNGSIGFISGDAGIHIYRIVQEALNNVSRHSGSDVVWVRVREAGQWLELEIEDRGRGLPEKFSSETESVGIGLIGMRERAESMGGRFSLRRPAEGGLLVSVRIPFGREPSAVDGALAAGR